MQNSVSFGRSEQRKGFMGTVLGSVANVGATVASGAAVGAAGGKLASLLPSTPSQAALDFQYADMFQKAVNSEELPEYLKKAKGTPAADLIERARNAVKTFGSCSQAKAETDMLGGIVSQISDSDLVDENLQKNIKALIEKITKLSGDTSAVDLTDKNSVLMKLRTNSEELAKKAKEADKNFGTWRETFMNKIKELKNADIDEIATKGAKELRKSTFLGVGIAVGIIGALVLNLVRNSNAGHRIAKQNKENAAAGAQK